MNKVFIDFFIPMVCMKQLKMRLRGLNVNPNHDPVIWTGSAARPALLLSVCAPYGMYTHYTENYSA